MREGFVISRNVSLVGVLFGVDTSDRGSVSCSRATLRKYVYSLEPA